jgi:hypothetical protein
MHSNIILSSTLLLTIPGHAALNYAYNIISLGLKRPEREADHSHPSTAQVQECVDLYLHSPFFVAWYLIKHRIRLQGMILRYAQEWLYFYLTGPTCGPPKRRNTVYIYNETESAVTLYPNETPKYSVIFYGSLQYSYQLIS